MPKFVVRRGRDAWVIEEAIIEADDAEKAEGVAYWKSEQRKLDWVETGDVRTYDDTEIMEGETRPLQEGEELEEHTIVAFTSEQRDTVLAALRLWQRAMERGELPSSLIDIATNSDAHGILDPDSIDEICETINV